MGGTGSTARATKERKKESTDACSSVEKKQKTKSHLANARGAEDELAAATARAEAEEDANSVWLAIVVGGREGE